MRFVVTGEWTQNRLLQTIVVLFCVYVAALWLTNLLLYFQNMGLTPSSVIAHYRGSEEEFLSPRSYEGMLEVSHFHLFAMGMLLLVLTHLILFVPLRGALKAWLIAVPFAAALLDEGAGWGVRFLHPGFALVKIAGFLLLQTSLAVLIIVSLWAVFRGSQQSYAGQPAGCTEAGAEGSHPSQR
jgi:hypothetical protein